MMIGYDMSHHQTQATFDKYLQQCDFMIIKATEGKTYTDTTFHKRAVHLMSSGKPYGFYHFCRPDNNNTSISEANHFITTVSPYITDKCMLALDYEGKALQKPFAWCIDWCNEVRKATDKNPLIYASASTIKKYHDRYKHWWTAHYNQLCENGCSHDSVNEYITQFRSNPVDTNTFNGSMTDWLNMCNVQNANNDWSTLYEWEEKGALYRIQRKESNIWKIF